MISLNRLKELWNRKEHKIITKDFYPLRALFFTILTTTMVIATARTIFYDPEYYFFLAGMIMGLLILLVPIQFAVKILKKEEHKPGGTITIHLNDVSEVKTYELEFPKSED